MLSCTEAATLEKFLGRGKELLQLSLPLFLAAARLQYAQSFVSKFQQLSVRGVDLQSFCANPVAGRKIPGGTDFQRASQ